MEQLIGNVRAFVQHRAGCKVIYGQGGKKTHVAEAPSISKRYMSVSGKHFGTISEIS